MIRIAGAWRAPHCLSRFGCLSFSSGSIPRPGLSPLARYQEKIRTKELREDSRQLESMQLLENLFSELQANRAQLADSRASLQAELARLEQAGGKANSTGDGGSGSGGSQSFFSALFGGGGSSKSSRGGSGGSAAPSQAAAFAPKGLYLHGGVGCGKTFMMDLVGEGVNGSGDRILVYRRSWAPNPRSLPFPLNRSSTSR